MEIVFAILLLVLVILFYFSNRGNKVNKWCTISGLFFWFGVFKEIYLFKIIPYLDSIPGNVLSHDFLIMLYSVQAWIASTLATPTAVYMSLYFCGMDEKNPKLKRLVGLLLCIPALALSLPFPPLRFIEYFTNYQAENRLFWILYGAYNFVMCTLLAVFLIAGVRNEAPGKVRKQKLLVTLIILPPVFYCLFAVYVIYPLGLDQLFDLWKGNVIVIALCLALYIYMAFREGSMGLRLTSETYNWTADMNIVSKGTAYTSHMLKNQTSKMEWCLDNLKSQYEGSGDDPPEELAILSRSIATLKGYTDRARKYSGVIRLSEEPCNLRALLDSAMPSCTTPIETSVSDDVYWVCDKTHMTEVFYNILTNAAEATRSSDVIEIHGGYGKKERFYHLSFTDHGDGMDSEGVRQMFTPYFTTKNTEHNFGLGLSYCKNVVEKHGGHIYAESRPGGGTTVTIAFPAKKVAMSGGVV